jgi:hypothetical protein
VLVQPHQFRIAGEIGDLDQIRRIVLAGKNPAEMTVDEALVPRRVDVGLRIRMQVMMAMLGCPHSTLFWAVLCDRTASANWNARLVR